jgi:hypothetical protein
MDIGHGGIMINLWRKLRQQDRIKQLESERYYLDGRLADFEWDAREFVMRRYSDNICRIHFAHLLNNIVMPEVEE